MNQPAYADPLGSFGDLSQLPAMNAPTSHPYQSGAAYPFKSQRPRVSNPSGGPTDATMRLLSAVMLVGGIVLAVMTLATGTVYLMVTAIVPMAIVLGIAGLISPDVVRAAGKYGGHLPRSYKAIAWGVIGLSFVITVLLVIALIAMGFKPGPPHR